MQVFLKIILGILTAFNFELFYNLFIVNICKLQVLNYIFCT